MATKNSSNLIASCGMNCGICMAFLREKNHCPGCRATSGIIKKSILNCRIKNCDERQKSKSDFCFNCVNYPCEKIKHLDKRYRTKYGMSMIDNLNKIKDFGLAKFVKSEKTRWACSACGNQICVHNKKCYFCEKLILK
jgi:hypothetical protein